MARIRPSHATRGGFFFLLSILCAGTVWGDETLRQVQRQLRARNYFQGAVDGRESLEATAAIKEFQRAKALDATGEADEETLRALGLRVAGESSEARASELGREWLAGYCRAGERGVWEEEERFYAEKVLYYAEGEVTREYLRAQRQRFDELWPSRRQTALLSYSSWNPERQDELWVSARMRNEVKSRSGETKVMTEELLFILRQSGSQWRLVCVREWPLAPPKRLP